jgi:hypothetical protein
MSEFYGFSLNMKKTHFSSPFRESCGSHFFSGSDVKPIYLKGSLSDALSVYRLANAIRRLSHRWNSFSSCDMAFRSLFDHLVNLIPKSLRFRISEQLGDGGFISNFDETTPTRARHGIEGYFVSHVTTPSSTRESEEIGLLLARLWVSSLQEERNTVPLRGQTKLRISRSLVHQWYNLGPWI